MSSIVQQAPQFDARDAARIAHDLFGLDVSVKPLPSERDQNFHLKATGEKAYVLKLANPAERLEVLDLQNKAMMHIQRGKKRLGFGTAVCPEVCPDLDGNPIASVEDGNGRRHLVRLLSYLPGKPLALVKPHDAGLLNSLGRFFGGLDRILQDFDHPAAHRDFHWDLKSAGPVIQRYLADIADAGRRDLVRGFLKRFLKEIAPLLPGLRTSVIHSDGNDYNVLVAPDGKWRLMVSGVIDFGDMIYSHTVNEVAIACAYAMLGKVDPLAAAKEVVAGYHDAFALNDTELSVLFDLICMRLCMSVCHCAHQSQAEPDNAYLRISEKQVWELLEKLVRIHPRFAGYVFREACGLAPVPRCAKIVKWLSAESRRFAPLIGADLKLENQLVLDLSIGSPLLGTDIGTTDTAAVGDRLFRQMDKAGAVVGIGRYNEARAIYTTDQFAVPAEKMPERRTVHLGIDLFIKSGAMVYAPMAGKVHSFRNNAIALDYGPTIILEHETGDGDRFYTLYGHLSPESLKGLEPGLTIARGQRLATVGSPEHNGGWPSHLHFQINIDMLGESGNFPGVARPSQQRVWTSIAPDPNAILRIPRRLFPDDGRSRSEIMAIRQRHLGKSLSISYDRPLKIVRGAGQYLYSQEGQQYLDGVNNVCHVGHCHPRVVAAGCRQMPVLNTNTRYLHDNIVAYTQRLLAKLPDPLSVCFFVCTGSEANELALRMARNYTGQRDLITVDGAYHGNTQALIDISPYKHNGPGGRGAPDWVQSVVMPDGYRGPHKGSDPGTGARYAAYVNDAVKRIQSRDGQPAAFICESMLGCGGQVVLPETYLEAAFKAVRAAGGVCIVDEVQVGFGRVGSHFWAFETQGVVPDIVTLGKPMGNGHPLAAVVTTPEIADAFANGMEYFNTFGGNPVSCAIGMAVLDVIQEEGLQENARKAGARLLKGLKELMGEYPLIGDVRGLGLYVGVELVADRDTLEPAAGHAAQVINRMRDHGILISTDGPLHNVLKLKPPMVFSEQNADEVVSTLDRVLAHDCLQGNTEASSSRGIFSTTARPMRSSRTK